MYLIQSHPTYRTVAFYASTEPCAPHLSLFLLTIVISKFFELFFLRQKYTISRTGPHTLHRYIPTRNPTTRTSPPHPEIPPTHVLFCPLFLFQICLNYFFSKKIHHTPTESDAHQCIPTASPLNPSQANLSTLTIFYPNIVFQICLNYFFNKKIPYTPPPSSIHRLNIIGPITPIR